jgi:hypothetical protein
MHVPLYQVDMVFDNGFIWAYTVGAKGTALRTLLGSGVWETRFSGTTDNLLGLGLQISGGDIKSWWCGTNGRWGDSTVIGPN